MVWLLIALLVLWVFRKFVWDYVALLIIELALRDRSGYHLPDYMMRYWLWKRPNLPRWLGWLRISARVHCILRSDTDRHTHDHPCWSISIILRNSYRELMPPPERRNFIIGKDQPGDFEEKLVCKVRRPGDIVFRRPTDRHRLEVEQPVWSLFISGPWCQNWGFYVPNLGKIFWRTYLNDWSSE